MKIKIKSIPKEMMEEGGYFNPYPFAGSLPTNPFSIINSMNYLNADNINSTVKSIDKEDANVEAEKGEVLFKFDKGGLFNIKGKRHSEGGTPIIADNGDFIFSRDNDLAITEDEKDLFDLKQNGKYIKSSSTPAKVLNNEVNPKHYNQLLSILDNPKSDDFARKTAALMLEKYQQKIGQIAYLQESKKNFPQGIPEFAKGTAPVDAPEFDDSEAKEKMFARDGGTNTFSPNQVNVLKDRGAWDNNDYWNRIANGLQDFGYTGNNDASQVQQFITQQYPQLINYSFNKGYWPNTNKGVNNYGDIPANTLSGDQQINAFNDGLRGVRAPMLQKKYFNSQQEYNDWTAQNNQVSGTNFYDTRNGDLVNFTQPILNLNQNTPESSTPSLNIPIVQGNPLTNIPSPSGQIPKAGTIPQGNRQGSFTGMNIPWNAQEMLSTTAPFLSALAQPTYYDILQQRHTPDVRLDRIDNQQEISDIKQQSSLAQREIANTDVGGKNAQIANSQARAQALSAISRSYANNNNVNAQISNQEDMTNFNSSVRDQDYNLQNIHTNYLNNTLSQQRRDEQLSNAFTDSLNKGLQVQSNLDALNQNISSQVMPYVDQYGNAPIILDPKTRIPVANPNWRGNPLNNPFIGGTTGRDTTSKYMAAMDQALEEGNTEKVRQLAAALYALNRQTRNQPSLLSKLN